MMLHLAGLLASMWFPGSAPAGSDTPLRAQVVVNAPIEEVWAAWTTEQGIESWLARYSQIELKPGGAYQTNAFGEVGTPGTVEMKVLGFEPPRVLALQGDAPADEFPEVADAKSLWIVVSLDPVDQTHTRVEYTMLGWQQGEQWDHARDFFEQADTYVLNMLKDRFEGEHDRLVPARNPLRKISQVIEVDAAPEVAWDALTTRDGLGAWLGDVQAVDLRRGGTIQIGTGDQATIERIVAYDPGRVLVTQMDLPESLRSSIGLAENTWTVTRTELTDSGTTRVTRTMLGWGSSPEWTNAKLFFEATLKSQMDTLGTVLGRGLPDQSTTSTLARGSTVLEQATRMLVGRWESQILDPDGVPTTIRNEVQEGPGLHGLVVTGWFITDDKPRLHARTMIWLDTASGQARFLTMEEAGSVIEGEITLTEQGFDWKGTSTGPAGETHPARFMIQPRGTGSYRLIMPGTDSSDDFEAIFERVARSSEAEDG